MIPDVQADIAFGLAKDAICRTREVMRGLEDIWNLLWHRNGEDKEVTTPQIKRLVLGKVSQNANIRSCGAWLTSCCMVGFSKSHHSDTFNAS